HCILPTGANKKRSTEFLARVSFRQFTKLQNLIDCYAEIIGLLFDPIPEFIRRFGSVDKIEPENVLLALNADVKTITVIRPFYQVMTALQRHPGSARRASRRRCKAGNQCEQNPAATIAQ